MNTLKLRPYKRLIPQALMLAAAAGVWILQAMSG